MVDVETIYRDFKEEFNPFEKLDSLRKRENALGSSRPFAIGGVVGGLVILERGVTADTDNPNLLTTRLRPLDEALGTLCVYLYPIGHSDPLEISCRIRIWLDSMTSVYNWVWDGINQEGVSHSFYYFRRLGSRANPIQSIVADTDLERGMSYLREVPQFSIVKSHLRHLKSP